MSRTALLAAGTTAFAAAVWAALDPSHDGLSLLLVAFALIAVGVVWLERAPDSAKELALIATLAAAAAAGRVLFAAIPGVQPVTVIAVAAGAALGARSGFAVGALAAFVSNFFLGQGTWTPWQMLALGSLWRRRRAGGEPAAPAGRARGVLLRARSGLQRLHGRLDMGRVLRRAHVADVRGGQRARSAVRPRACDRERGDRFRRRSGVTTTA